MLINGVDDGRNADNTYLLDNKSQWQRDKARTFYIKKRAFYLILLTRVVLKQISSVRYLSAMLVLAFSLLGVKFAVCRFSSHLFVIFRHGSLHYLICSIAKYVNCHPVNNLAVFEQFSLSNLNFVCLINSKSCLVV